MEEVSNGSQFVPRLLTLLAYFTGFKKVESFLPRPYALPKWHMMSIISQVFHLAAYQS